MERRKRECSCGGHDMGVGIMHEPLCEINDAGQIAMLEQECAERDARIAAPSPPPETEWSTTPPRREPR